MKFNEKNSPPGEFWARGLVYRIEGWVLTESFYSSLENIRKDRGPNVHWPVEVWDNGMIYVPAAEELGEERT